MAQLKTTIPQLIETKAKIQWAYGIGNAVRKADKLKRNIINCIGYAFQMTIFPENEHHSHLSYDERKLIYLVLSLLTQWASFVHVEPILERCRNEFCRFLISYSLNSSAFERM